MKICSITEVAKRAWLVLRTGEKCCDWITVGEEDEALGTGYWCFLGYVNVLGFYYEYRSFTKQSEVTVFKPKEGFSGFHVETRLMWGKCQSGSPKGRLLP